MTISIVDETEINSVENAMILAEIGEIIIAAVVVAVNGMMEGETELLFLSLKTVLSFTTNSSVQLDYDEAYVSAHNICSCFHLFFSCLQNDSTICFYSRDRPNQFRRQYPGSAGPPGRDFPPRYNRSPNRYDMSPPHNKRVRRDW